MQVTIKFPVYHHQIWFLPIPSSAIDATVWPAYIQCFCFFNNGLSVFFTVALYVMPAWGASRFRRAELGASQLLWDTYWLSLKPSPSVLIRTNFWWDDARPNSPVFNPAKLSTSRLDLRGLFDRVCAWRCIASPTLFFPILRDCNETRRLSCCVVSFPLIVDRIKSLRVPAASGKFWVWKFLYPI